MRTHTDLRAEVHTEVDAARVILDSAEREKRDLTESENLEVKSRQAKGMRLAKQANAAEAQERAEGAALEAEERVRIGGSRQGEQKGNSLTWEQRAEALGQAIRGWWHRDATARSRALSIVGFSENDLEQRAALQEDNATEGQSLVPTEFLAEILRGFDPGVVRPISRVLPMESKTLDIPQLASKPTVAIVAEEGTVGDAFGADPLSKVTLTAKKLISVVTASKELLDDTPIEMGRFLLAEIVEAIGQTEDAQGLEGDGTGDNFTGIFTVSGTSVVTVGAQITNVDPFVTAMRKLAEKSPLYIRESTWVISPLLWELLGTLRIPQYSTDTEGDYMVNPLPTSGTPLSLLGRPVVLSNQILNNRGGGTNETTAYLGAFRRGLVFGVRNQPSLFVDPYSAASAWQTKLYLGERVGIAVGLPEAFVKVETIQTT